MIVQSAMRNNINDIAFTIPKDDLNKALAIVNDLKRLRKTSAFMISSKLFNLIYPIQKRHVNAA